MRTIKFRAWDKDDKVMRSWDELNLEKDKGDDFYLIGYKESPAVTSFDHEQILLQYTGLKDKNGKEIYEFDFFRDNDGFLWKVFFEDGMFIAKGGEWNLTETLIEFTPEHCEVIGNVFENEDLLEG